MGRLTYDSTMSVDFDDRTLAHLQVVIAAKLRIGEGFFFSWKDDGVSGDGRTIIWIHPTIPITFKFYGSRPPIINRDWANAMLATANSNRGLHLLQESEAVTAPAQEALE